jgi:probable F420-dependent oxidoreductase
MRFGVVFPHAEIGNDPDTIRAFALTAERVGFHHVLVYDHVLGAVRSDRSPPLVGGSYDENSPFHEVFALFGFLAAVTTSLRLVTGVLVLPQRQTALVAKQAAEVDLLSGGRLDLGVGVGWNYVEYDALGQDFSTRGARQEEQIEVLRRLWNEPVVDFHGRWHDISRAGILPRPQRGIPVLLGGASDVAYRRAARIGDGFILNPTQRADEAIPTLHRYLDEAGRDVSAFAVTALVRRSDAPGAWLDDVVRARDAGATAITVANMGQGLAGEAHVDALADLYAAMASRCLSSGAV